MIACQHRSQVHLAGDLDELLGLRLVLHARQVDHDRVALAQDLRLGDAKAVDALPDALDREIEARGVERSHWLLGDRDATLQIEPEGWCVAVDQRGDQTTEREHQNRDERIDQLLAH